MTRSSQINLALRYLILIPATLLFLSACDVDNDDDQKLSASDSAQLFVQSTTNAEGQVMFEIGFPYRITKATYTVSGPGVISVDSVSHETLGKLDTVGLERTGAGYATIVTAVEGNEKPSSDFGDGTTNLAVSLTDGSGKPVVDSVISLFAVGRNDDNYQSGAVRFNVHVQDTFLPLDNLMNDIDSVLSSVRGRFQAQTAIKLEESRLELNHTGPVPHPGSASEFYLSETSQALNPSIHVFIAEGIENSTALVEVFSRSMPGPVGASAAAGITVNLSAASGFDGDLSGEERKILEDELLRALGAYFGLDDIVSFSGSDVVAVDEIDDTLECTRWLECAATEGIRTNIMFPDALYDSDGHYIERENFTAEQEAVINRHAAVS
jgi:hypothetical protein